MERRNNEKVETTANEAIGILETLTEVPTKPEDVVPLNIEKALASYTEAERKRNHGPCKSNRRKKSR